MGENLRARRRGRPALAGRAKKSGGSGSADCKTGCNNSKSIQDKVSNAVLEDSLAEVNNSINQTFLNIKNILNNKDSKNSKEKDGISNNKNRERKSDEWFQTFQIKDISKNELFEFIVILL